MSTGTDLGKAYVQIMPSAEGIKKNLEDILGKEVGDSGKKAGTSLVGKMKGAIAAAGIGAAIAATVNEGGQLQQSLGGVETLFKNNADTVKNYASQAYKTAGLSANEYMRNVTSFSASLISSVGGDTAKAAEVANMAMIDMSDNANKMGTSMEDIQNAYQGFAKQNYTMLDNLKLGYGGTKTEMERLLADATKLTGVKYDINNLSDVYSAIHAVQEELGITGTTALEADQTLEGSFNSMKAAAKDFMGNLTLGLDISGPMKNMVTTASTFIFGNLIPALANIAIALPGAIINGIQVAIPILIEQLGLLITSIVTYFTENGPVFMQKGMELVQNIVNGILTNLPVWISTLSNLVNQGITLLMTYLPLWLQKGIELVGQIAQGILNNLPQIASSILSLVINAIATFAANLPQFLQKGIELVGQVASGLIQGVPDLLGKISGILADAANTFLSYDWLSIGADIVKGVASGIANAGGAILDALLDAAGSAFDGVLGFFGIHSPSKLMEEEVGYNLPAGQAKGILKKGYLVKDALKKISSDVMKENTLKVTNDDMYNLSKSSSYEPANRDINDSSIARLGDYIVNALMYHYRLIEEGFRNLRIVANNREVARYVGELGFVKG